MRKFLWFSLPLLLGLLGDVATKIAIRRTFALGERRTILPGWFDLLYSRNTGAAFSFLRDTGYGPYVLVPVAIAGLGLIVMLVRKLPPERRAAPALLGLIASGALGNLIDRLMFGGVTDFLLVHWHEHAWPIFNVADISLVAGVIGLLLFAPPEPKDRT